MPLGERRSLLCPVPGSAGCWSHRPLSPPLAGREGVQVRGVRAGVHAAGQHEAAHADPHQRPALPVPHLLQDLCAEADPQDPHDCALTGEAIQMQGIVRGPGRGCRSGEACNLGGLAWALMRCAPGETLEKPGQAGLSAQARESSFVTPPSVHSGKQLILARLLRAALRAGRGHR